MHEILNYNYEVFRKFIHLSSSLIALLLWYLGKEVFLPYIITASIIFPFFDLLRPYNPFLNRFYHSIFGFVTRSSEHYSLSGASWIFIGSAVTILFFDEQIAIIA